MTEALDASDSVKLEFGSHEQAIAFRAECYRHRAAYRLVGMKDYDRLKFRISGRRLIISRKTIMILGKAV